MAYECTRTITTIYPDKGLIGKAAKCVGIFLVAKTNDIKYIGKTIKETWKITLVHHFKNGWLNITKPTEQGFSCPVTALHNLPGTKT